MKLAPSFAHDLIAYRATPERKRLEGGHPSYWSHAERPIPQLSESTSTQLALPGQTFQTEHAQRAGRYGSRVSAGRAPSRLGWLPGLCSCSRCFRPDTVSHHSAGKTRRLAFSRLAPGWLPSSQTLWRGSAPPATRASATASTPRPPRSTAARCGCCRCEV